MKSFNNLLVAALKQFVRDRTALFFTFAFPVLFMVIFGLVFGGGGDIHYDIGLANRDNSPVGQGLSQAFHDIPIFTVTDGDLDSLLEKLREGDFRAVVLVPEDAGTNVGDNQPVFVKVYYDPSQMTSSQIILSAVQETLNQANQQISGPSILRLETESVSLKDLRNIDYLVPGILAMSIMILGLFGSLTLVDWREKRVLRRLGATPLKRSVIVSSQVVYRLILAVVQAVMIIVIAFFAFDVQMVGSWVLLVGLVLLGALTFIGIGYFAVSRVKTTEGAMPIIQIIQFPMLFLSGIFFPVEIMPDFMRPIINAIPVTYLGDALRQVMVDATPLFSLTTDLAVLGGWMVVSILLAVRLFRWE